MRMAGSGSERKVHPHGVVEFDDPDTGKHVVMMDGMTVESGGNDALAVVSVAAVVSCGACLKRWLMPVADYRQGWNTCRHCNARLYLPALFVQAGKQAGGALTLIPLRGHEFADPG
jgi:hypothetical protein